MLWLEILLEVPLLVIDWLVTRDTTNMARLALRRSAEAQHAQAIIGRLSL